ncbi:MAG: hypothetical protein ACTHKL_03645, partial [Streptosporangiaceae bacterium]
TRRDIAAPDGTSLHPTGQSLGTRPGQAPIACLGLHVAAYGSSGGRTTAAGIPAPAYTVKLSS